MDTNSVIFIAVIIVLGFLAMFVVPRWLFKRAIRQVIRIFKKHNAVGIKNAMTVEELGLKPYSMMVGLLRGRDYKQYALKALIKAEIIKEDGSGGLYISEDKLIASGLDQDTLYSRNTGW